LAFVFFFFVMCFLLLADGLLIEPAPIEPLCIDEPLFVLDIPGWVGLPA
jgi:hypothetical protein